MLQRVYDWTMRVAAHRHAGWGLALVSFIESSIFPIPPDVLLIPMCLADRRRAWMYAAVCTLASAVGGLLGYAIGFFLFETVGRWIIDLYSLDAQFAVFRDTFNHYGAWIVVLKGMTPIPFKLITITAGVTKLDLTTFILASIVSRSIRFFLVAGLIRWFGEPIRDFIERRLTLVTTLFLVGLIGGFLILKVL
ncbi:MAG: DedA family protein [Alphaproteobacteria bacterium]|nr:DedA family protein [Alphaproteobacteria bacterium]